MLETWRGRINPDSTRLMHAYPEDMLTEAVRAMFDDLDAFVAKRPLHRLCLAHGYEVASVSGGSRPNPFNHSRPIDTATAEILMPVVWEVEPGSVPARASDTPTTLEPERLRSMLDGCVAAGGFGSAGVVELVDWRGATAGCLVEPW